MGEWVEISQTPKIKGGKNWLCRGFPQCTRPVTESGASKSWNSLYYTTPAQNHCIAFLFQHVLHSSSKDLYWEWIFAEQMGSQHSPNHTIAFSVFSKELCTRNLEECVVRGVPTYFTNAT